MDHVINAGPEPHPELSRFRSAVGGTAQTVLASYRRGGLTLVAAPAIVALIVVPEFAQHVAEIQLGMFESKEAFKALSNDPTRWAFGYVKVAGVVLATLATARFWALGSVRRALLVSPGTLLRTLFAIGLNSCGRTSLQMDKRSERVGCGGRLGDGHLLVHTSGIAGVFGRRTA